MWCMVSRHYSCTPVCSLNRYLHSLLCKNQTVTEGNRSLLVETLRSISEILIWGDQNDSSVFEWVVYQKYCIQNPLHVYFYFLISYNTLFECHETKFLLTYFFMNHWYMYFLWGNFKKNWPNNISCCTVYLLLLEMSNIFKLSLIFKTIYYQYLINCNAILSFQMPH